MKSMFKDACILFAITVIAGLLLGGVYQITKDPIAAQEELAKANACREVFADAADFEQDPLFEADGSTPVYNMLYPNDSIDNCQRALSAGGELLGYVLTVTSHEGYGGDIKFMMGIRNDGTLNGISLLSISETAGLGMQAGEVLVPQFAGKNQIEFTYTKDGATSDSEIDAISGATITTNAVTNGVNAGLSYFYSILSPEEGGE
ncbi:MAG: RnfABCDGE type electron transport complex subunit G [Lachnospiraceae bacterium]|nr:RnfABCDGE type electron transport complex subunit G [Lachnospiraceae bacterium]